MSVSNIGNLQTNNVHPDQILTKFAVEWKYPSLVANLIASAAPVAKNKDEYPIFNVDEENREVPTARGPGGAYNQVEFSVSKDNYHCEGRGLENGIPWEVRANADATWQEYISGGAIARRLKRMVEVKREIELAEMLTTTGNYASGFYDQLTTDQFNDGSTDGISKLLDMVGLIEKNTGGENLKMLVTRDVWVNMLRDTNFRAVMTQNLLANKAQVAEAIGVDEIIVVNAQKNTADKGQTASKSEIWGTNNLWILTCPPPGSDNGVPATARTFVWNNSEIGTSGAGEVVKVIRDERYGVDYIQYGKYYDIKLQGVDTSNDIISGIWLDDVYG